VVARHGELRMLFFYDEIVQVLLLREFITESQTVVEKAETDNDAPVVHRLVEGDFQFIIVVADFAFFAPYRTPSLVEGRSARVLNLESVHQVRALVHARLVFHFRPFEIGFLFGVFAFQFQSEGAGLDDRLVFKGKVVHGSTLFVEAEVHHQIPVW